MAEGNSSSDRARLQALVNRHVDVHDVLLMTSSIREAYLDGNYRRQHIPSFVFVGTTILDQAMSEGPSEEMSPVGLLRRDVGHKLRALREDQTGLGEEAYRELVRAVLLRTASSLFFGPSSRREVGQYVDLQTIATRFNNVN